MSADPRPPLSRVERIGLLGALALVMVLMWPLRHYLTDDTFIHLQYARHLARGEGLVFNLGERVYGCTSPLWVGLISAGVALGLDGLRVARALGLLATLASVVLFFQLMRHTLRTPGLRVLATLTWAAHAWMLRWSLSGMETPLAVALTLAGFVAFTSGPRWGTRAALSGTSWALAALARPEGVFLLMLWGLYLLLDADGRDGLRRAVFGVLPALAIYGGWLVFARSYFGTFWPQTLSAKTAGATGLAYEIGNLWRQARIVGASDGVLVVLLVAAVAATLVTAGRRPWRWEPARLLPWAWTLGLPALYVARGVPVISRYLLVLLPVLAMLAWRAAEGWWTGGEPEPRRVRRALALGGIVAVLSLALNLTVYRAVVVPQVRSFTAGLERTLVWWGRWLGEHAAPGDAVATPDIGAIGYFSGRRVLDLGGLVTPGMVPLLEQAPEEDVIAGFGFAAVGRPAFLVDRDPAPDRLLAGGRYAACLVALGHAEAPNLGIARPGPVIYTVYRIRWSAYDSLRVGG